MRLAVSRFWYLLYKTTAAPPGIGATADVTLRLATQKDRASFGMLAYRRGLDELFAWLEEDDTWLFVAVAQGHAIAYDCVSWRLPSKPPFRDLALARDEVWVRDVYTAPEFRRLRVNRALRAYRNAALREIGVRGTLSAVSEDNVASLVATYDATVSRVEGLAYRRVLFHRRVRHHGDARARLEQVVGAARATAPALEPAAWTRGLAVLDR
jgi:GNAT superfamily N-acetyltransferase